MKSESLGTYITSWGWVLFSNMRMPSLILRLPDCPQVIAHCATSPCHGPYLNQGLLTTSAEAHEATPRKPHFKAHLVIHWSKFSSSLDLNRLMFSVAYPYFAAARVFVELGIAHADTISSTEIEVYAVGHPISIAVSIFVELLTCICLCSLSLVRLTCGREHPSFRAFHTFVELRICTSLRFLLLLRQV